MDDIEPPRPAPVGTPPQPARRPAPAPQRTKPAAQHRAVQHPHPEEDEPFLPIRKEKKKRRFWRFLFMLVFAILLVAAGFVLGRSEKFLPDYELPWEVTEPQVKNPG